MTPRHCKIAVVIPCFRVKAHLLDVIAKIGEEVSSIYIVDDACPEGSGQMVLAQTTDTRVRVLFHERNQGVGAATLTGYQAAHRDGAQVIVKIDGDGQMDPTLIQDFVSPILEGEADYTKGNRFYHLEGISGMPKIRIFGNAVLSFFSKISSGYWNLFDPTNGYTAIEASVIEKLPLEKISRRFFFESDLLFRLNIIRAVVIDIPMSARYADENSNLRILKVLPEFFFNHIKNTTKRITYNYYLRDMSVASIELPFGLFFSTFGMGYGAYHWWNGYLSGQPSLPGTVVLSALAIIVGLQLILAFINFDIASVPSRPLTRSRWLKK